VYGPARPNGSGSSIAALIGRLLGLAIVIVAVGALGVGVMTLFGGQLAAPTVRPTPFGAISPSPSFAPGPTATPSGSTPLTTPTPTSTPAGSGLPATPTPTAPLIAVGPGFVTFGTRADSELRIRDPRTSFALEERITWSAYLIDAVNSADVRVLIIKDDPAAPGGERLIRTDEISPRVTDAQIFVRRIRPDRLLDGPGVYTIRYVRGDRLLSEGRFLVTE